MPSRGAIALDGSAGEGGGQILRTALTLSCITGRGFSIDRIRAKRLKPGLRPQHREAARAAATLCGADLRGAEMGSPALEFHPGRTPSPGEWTLDIGTAGSAPLLFQTLCYPLALAGGESRLTLLGGTHLDQSPTFHYLALVWGPALARLGFPAELSMRTAGFYPEGGGELTAVVGRARPMPPLDLRHRGNLEEVEVLSLVAGVEGRVAERQAERVTRRLREQGVVAQANCVPVPARRSRGCHVLVVARFERTRSGHGGVAAQGVDPDRAGDAAATGFATFLGGRAAVDRHLGDQLLLPAALLAARRVAPPEGVHPATTYTVAEVTRHLLTNAEVVRRFLDVRIEISGAEGQEGEVRVAPAAS